MEHGLVFVQNALARFSGKRVLCLGDVMLDRFIHGRVERISPEAPAPILCVTQQFATLGGAGNVLRNLLALRAEVAFFSIVGDDEPGRRITELIGTEQKVEAHLLIEPERQTTVKTRFIAESQHMIRVDEETNRVSDENVLDDLLHLALEALPSTEAVIISDYGKGVLSPSVLRRIIDAAQMRSLPVVIDPKGRDFTRYYGATLITPNAAELSLATSLPATSEEEIERAARHLLKEGSFACVVATRGKAGLSVIERGEDASPDTFTVQHIPARIHEVFDVSGAGDTVAATLTVGLASGLPPGSAAFLANLAAGIVVGKTGTSTAEPTEIIESFSLAANARSRAKYCEHEELRERVLTWRRRGLRIAMTNGVFDLLHPGHISLLTEARAAGDCLIVAINSDLSTRRIKGPGRPVQDQEARARILCALEMVSLVTIFDEDTPLAVVEAIEPDFLIKGGDYRLEDVVGREIVERRGGKILLIPLVEDQSTTGMITRMTSSPPLNAGPVQ